MSVMQRIVKHHIATLKPLATLLVTREKNITETTTAPKKAQRIARPQRRKKLALAIQKCELLGTTQDGKAMYLYEPTHTSTRPSPIIKEIGRLREVAFRAVGEGSNKRRDIDAFDKHYMHLVLWDTSEQEIVGAYRFGDAKKLFDNNIGLYSSTLFNYSDAMHVYFNQGLELGRSFIQPKYWGKRSLDYLWFGIGAFLQSRPQYRYLFGPVSMSNSMPHAAKDLLVSFYRLYFGGQQQLATANTPYPSTTYTHTIFAGNAYKEDFITLKTMLSDMNCSVPTLYKQYAEVFEDGGVQFIDFGIDPDFNNCVDGLVMADMRYIKEKKRRRYMGE